MAEMLHLVDYLLEFVIFCPTFGKSILPQPTSHLFLFFFFYYEKAVKKKNTKILWEVGVMKFDFPPPWPQFHQFFPVLY